MDAASTHQSDLHQNETFAAPDARLHQNSKIDTRQRTAFRGVKSIIVK